MNEISHPKNRTFWKVTGSGVTHTGFTEPNQVTTSGQPTMEYDADATGIFPALPESGTLTEGERYSYNKGIVEVRQTHDRTVYAPEETPALFMVYRANTEGEEWIANEKVIAGDTRTFDGTTYRCIQSHVTQEDWTPTSTLGVLWLEVVEEPQTDEWSAGVAYSVDDIVTYEGNTYKCLQAHTSIATWTPSAVPALWQLQ